MHASSPHHILLPWVGKPTARKVVEFVHHPNDHGRDIDQPCSGKRCIRWQQPRYDTKRSDPGGLLRCLSHCSTRSNALLDCRRVQNNRLSNCRVQWAVIVHSLRWPGAVSPLTHTIVWGAEASSKSFVGRPTRLVDSKSHHVIAANLALSTWSDDSRKVHFLTIATQALFTRRQNPQHTHTIFPIRQRTFPCTNTIHKMCAFSLQRFAHV